MNLVDGDYGNGVYSSINGWRAVQNNNELKSSKMNKHGAAYNHYEDYADGHISRYFPAKGEFNMNLSYDYVAPGD